MKILAISDVHSKENDNLFDYLNNNEIDLVLVSGDITDFGPLDFVEGFLGRIKDICDVVAIPGNCDPTGICSAINNSDAYCLHKNIITYQNTIIFGYGGSNPTPFDTPGEIEDSKIFGDIHELIFEYETIANTTNKIKILLTHAPPYNTSADLVEGGEHVGSHGVRKIIEDFDIDINICGHIHEARSIDKIGDTIIANPGILENNGAVLINVNEDNTFDLNIISLE